MLFTVRTAAARRAAALSALAFLPVTAGAAPVINEIMYRPGSGYPENAALEYVEIHNPDASAANLSGWAFTSGFAYTFPAGTSIAAGGYLVIAANPTALTGQMTVQGGTPLGPWQSGTLSNNGERIRLSSPNGDGTFTTQDEVTYASEGDWAQRDREAQWGGWVWSTPAAAGRAMELRNPGISNDNGQNWSPSTAPQGGTPGAANSVKVSNVPPIIHGVSHSPAVPRSSDSVIISCEVNDEAPPAERNATLFWRNASTDSPGDFQSRAMTSDGTGRFRAALAPAADKTIIEFYVSSTDTAGTRTWPAATVNDGQAANGNYQVDNEPSSADTDTYRLILTGTEAAAYEWLAPNDGSNNKIDRQFNTTVIKTRGSDSDIRYTSSIRFRGNSSRGHRFKPLRVSIPNDEEIDGFTDFNLNPRNPYLQHLGMRLLQASGVAAPDTIPVEVRRNGVEYTSNSTSTGDFGKWVLMEDLNSRMADRHWPNASGGNLYKKGRPDEFWRNTGWDIPGDPNGVLDGWLKQNNSSENDWTDLTTFFARYQAQAAPHFSGGNANDVNSGDWLGTGFSEIQTDALDAVADLNQWARWFAVMTLLQDNETNISNGQDDDYGLYFLPSSGNRRRAQLLSHDLDTILGRGEGPLSPTEKGLFDMTAQGSVFKPLLPLIGNSLTTGNESFRIRYINNIRELAATVFNADTGSQPNPAFNALVDKHLTGWIPAEQIAEIKSFMAARVAYLLGQAGTTAAPPPAATSLPTFTKGGGTLIISELLASNVAAHAHSGTFPDVIELRNTGAAPIDLAGRSISDDPAQKTKFVFPSGATLAAGQFLVLYADSEFTLPGLHTGFQLSQGGGGVYLYDTTANNQTVLDSITYGPQATDLSIGRTGAAQNVWTLCTPTIGAANAVVPGFGAPASLRINEWLGNPDYQIDEDFLEIYNPGAQPVAMGGMYVTDDFINTPTRHVLPPLSYIGPKGYHVFVAEGNNASPANASELPFSIDGTFGWLALLGANRTIIDRVDTVSQSRDQSTARSPDGTNVYATLTVSSPGLPNAAPPAAFTALLNHLRISEFLYKPAGGNDYEFLELVNTGTAALDLSGVRFTNGIDYVFPAGTTLAGGRYVVLARNRTALLDRFPNISALLAPGQYSGALDNNGETIALTLPKPWDVNILNFSYNVDWEPRTFNEGYSLVTVDSVNTPARDWDKRDTWTASGTVSGSPGTEGPPSVTSPLTVAGVIDVAFSYQITASRGPTSYGATGLPPGLTVNTVTGSITGTPVQSGTFTITVTATNDAGTGDAGVVLTVAGHGPLAKFTWDFAPATAEAGRPFPVLVTARDAQNRVVTSYGGTIPLTGESSAGPLNVPTVMITEITDESEDRFELQNTGSATASTAGWFVVVNDSSNVGSSSSTRWALPATMAPGAVITVSESQSNGSATYFGSSISWTQNLARGWIMLFDQNSTMRDFFAWGYPSAELGGVVMDVNGKTVTVTQEMWTGDGAPVGERGAVNNSWQRRGTADNNRASDWAFGPSPTWGSTNTNLSVPWNTGSVQPATLTFSGGFFAGFVTVGAPATGVRLTASASGIQAGQSSSITVTAATPDSDSDGMPNAYESANGLNPARNDAAGDLDGDGFTNLQEYYAGTAPNNAASVLTIQSWSRTAPNQVSITWQAAAGRLYRVESSTALTGWLPVPGQTFVRAAAGSQTATFTAPAGMTEGGFYRVRLVTP